MLPATRTDQRTTSVEGGWVGRPVTVAWFDKVKTCVGWDTVDRTRIANLRHCLNSDLAGVIETLGNQWAQFKGAQPLMANARFVQRLHGVLREWLVGLLDGTYDEQYVKERWMLGRRLWEADLTFEDIILLKELVWTQLFELVQGRLDEQPQTLASTMRALDKALNLDLALIHSGYLQVHDDEMERALLNRFLAVTGFSRTLYENLAEAQERGEAGG